MTARPTRRIATVFTAAALLVSGLTIPATAHNRPGSTKVERVEHARSHVEAAKLKVAEAKALKQKADTKAESRKATARLRKAQAQARKAAAKARRLARFVTTGEVAGVVDGDTLLVSVKGGNRDWRGQTVAVDVAEDAKVERDDASATLAEIQQGDHVMMKGSLDGDENPVATKVLASSPEVDPQV